MQSSSLLSRLKGRVVPAGVRVRRMRGGLLRGLHFPVDLRTGTQVYLGLWERETHAWMRRLARDVATVIDVGASDGPLTLWALARTPAVRVLACEPREECHEAIREAARLNGVPVAGRLEIHGGLVGNVPGPGLHTLDGLAEGAPHPCFIKVDVDGPELEVIQGAATLLAGDCRLVIETHSQAAETACLMHLERLGYTTRVIYNAWWRRIVPEQRPREHNRWLAAWREDASPAAPRT